MDQPQIHIPRLAMPLFQVRLQPRQQVRITRTIGLHKNTGRFDNHEKMIVFV